MMNINRWYVGDILVGTMHNEGVERIIKEVRKTGYTWAYPDIPEKSYRSENSCDPLLNFGWVLRV